MTEFIAEPERFSFIVACLRRRGRVLSLTSAKSGALIGVLISVTTIPAAANIGVAAASATGTMARRDRAAHLNLAAIFLAGVGTLYLERRLYRRRQAPCSDEARCCGPAGSAQEAR